jgi:hypothetical protein
VRAVTTPRTDRRPLLNLSPFHPHTKGDRPMAKKKAPQTQPLKKAVTAEKKSTTRNEKGSNITLPAAGKKKK